MSVQAPLSSSLEEVPCPLCRSTARRKVFELHDRLHLTAEAFTVVSCLDCLNTYLTPRPRLEQLGRYYPPAYWHTEKAPQKSIASMVGALEARYRRALLQEEVDRIKKLLPPGGCLLDVGCGSGDIVKLACENGLRASGIELAAEAVTYARDVRKLDIQQGTLEEGAFASGSFDAVSMFHVLEHVPDPIATLREAGRIVRPDGHVLVQVPNFAGLQSLMFKQRWYGLDAPRHFHHFTPDSLTRAFLAAGLEPVSMDHHSFRCNPVILVSTMFPTLEPHLFSIRENEGRPQLMQKALYLAMTWLVSPWAWFESVLGRGAVITLLGRPKVSR